GAGSVNVVGGTVTVSGDSTESATKFTIDATAQFLIEAELTLKGTTITNNGAVNWVNGEIDPDLATNIINNAQFNISAKDDTMTDRGGGALFTNNGQILVSLGGP